MNQSADKNSSRNPRGLRFAVVVVLLAILPPVAISFGIGRDEAGSSTGPYSGGRYFDLYDAGSATEAGSSVRNVMPGAEAGSATGGGFVPEAGSATAGSATAGSTARHMGETFRAGTTPPHPDDGAAIRFRDVAEGAIALLLGLLLLAAAYCLFRIGGRRRHHGELWSRQMNLAGEIAQQMDVFLVAAYREEWDVCRRALASLNDLNGQRTILLGDEANRRVLEFITTAIDCRIRRDVPEHLPQLRAVQVHALAALRTEIGQPEGLSETLLKSLRDTRHLYRSLRDTPPADAV